MRARREGGEMAVGDWGLVECNDPSPVFTVTPYLGDDTTPHKAMDKFSDELYCDPVTGHRLYTAFMSVKMSWRVKRKFVKHSAFRFDDRLFIYLADWIEHADPTFDADPFPHLDQHFPHDYTFDPKLPRND